VVSFQGRSSPLLTLSQHDVVYSAEHPIEFRDRFTPVYLTLRVSHCRFPKAGGYEMILMVDRDVIAQRVFHVTQDGVGP